MEKLFVPGRFAFLRRARDTGTVSNKFTYQLTAPEKKSTIAERTSTLGGNFHPICASSSFKVGSPQTSARLMKKARRLNTSATKSRSKKARLTVCRKDLRKSTRVQYFLRALLAFAAPRALRLDGGHARTPMLEQRWVCSTMIRANGKDAHPSRQSAASLQRAGCEPKLQRCCEYT